MSEVADHAPALLRQMRDQGNRIVAKRSRLVDGVHDFTVRVISIEEDMGAMNRRIDRVEGA